MSDVNTVVVSGRLTHDPDTHTFESGNSKTRISIASNRTFKGKEETCYLDIDCWGVLGELVAKYCEKGKTVTVTGRLSFDTWASNEGQKRSKLYITASDVSFGPKRAENSEEGASSGVSKENILEISNKLAKLINNGIDAEAAAMAVATTQ